MANSITADEIREQFSQAMSAMYQQEVPQYGTLLELVADVNLAVLENNPQLHEKMANIRRRVASSCAVPTRIDP